MKEKLRNFISNWAFLPMSQFSNDDSLHLLRIDFGIVSKTGMLVDATFPQEVDFPEDEVEKLDTVNDFAKYLEGKSIKKLNNPPKGYA